MLNNITENLQSEVQGNIFIESAVAEFNEGNFINTIINSVVGDYAIILDKDALD